MAFLEVCVDSIEALREAEAGGASRIEICSRLDLGGLSPERKLLAEARARTILPLVVMVRPREGSFVCSDDEIASMKREIRSLRDMNVEGVALGALTADGKIELSALRGFVAAARPMSVTFHRAFDEVRDPFTALDDLVELGVDRVLTSGGASSAFEGRRRLRALVERARGRIVVMAGGGVRRGNAAAILAEAGVSELHGSVPFRLPSG